LDVFNIDEPSLSFFAQFISPPNLVEGGGFEPPKAEPSDLQSDPFGRSGTPPEKMKPQILRDWALLVNRYP
jgi:hypothetical protein